jgi:hypothetical protein
MSADRFNELLPWYVNGTISDEDRAWVDGHLRSHPDAQAELAWYQSLQTRMRDNAPAVPATIGLARTMQLIRGDQPSFSERVTAFFAGFGLRPTAAFAGLAVVAVQAGFIFTLLNGPKDDTEGIRATGATVVTDAPLLKLNFAPDAKEADIRLLLISVHGDLVAGPGQLGDYYVRVPAGTEGASVAALKTNPIVQAAALAAGVPPRE